MLSSEPDVCLPISLCCSIWRRAHGISYLVRTMPSVIGYGAALAISLGVFDYSGGSLKVMFRDPNIDEVERKEILRKNRRRPIEEAIENVGEGRGMFPNKFRSPMLYR